jgi:23S rRNA pseudouridine1911/1915/1917 synthase
MAVVAGGKEAQTSYTVLDRLATQTVIRCDLHTGRTHQIRVHMKMLGYPVVGDPKYGRRKDDPRWTGQALHAWRLSFRHPETQEDKSFYVPPPPEYLRFLREEKAVKTLAEIESM